jgi:Cysteine-rich secretory protein family
MRMMNVAQCNHRRRQARSRLRSHACMRHLPKLRPIPEDCLPNFDSYEQDTVDDKDYEVQDLKDRMEHSPTTVREARQVYTDGLKSPTLHLFHDAVELVDKERAQHGLRPFRWSHSLSKLAAQQAQLMAECGTIFHSVSTISELIVMLSSSQVAENVQRGDSIRSMHNDTMHVDNVINRMNVLSEQFTEFGIGIVEGIDGMLYSCQLFRNAT